MAKVNIKNTSARLKHLSLGDGQTVVVPPTLPGENGIDVTLESTDEEKRFGRALKAAQRWIDSGELVVEGLRGQGGKGKTEAASKE